MLTMVASIINLGGNNIYNIVTCISVIFTLLSGLFLW
ncbi:hypothetical protein ESCOMM254M_19155 [Escherichia coli]